MTVGGSAQLFSCVAALNALGPILDCLSIFKRGSQPECPQVIGPTMVQVRQLLLLEGYSTYMARILVPTGIINVHDWGS